MCGCDMARMVLTQQTQHELTILPLMFLDHYEKTNTSLPSFFTLSVFPPPITSSFFPELRRTKHLSASKNERLLRRQEQ